MKASTHRNQLRNPQQGTFGHCGYLQTLVTLLQRNGPSGTSVIKLPKSGILHHHKGPKQMPSMVGTRVGRYQLSDLLQTWYTE